MCIHYIARYTHRQAVYIPDNEVPGGSVYNVITVAYFRDKQAIAVPRGIICSINTSLFTHSISLNSSHTNVVSSNLIA